MLDATIDGHAIEVRLCAEDPAAGFLRRPARCTRSRSAAPSVRVDTGVESGSEVSPYYDSMLAKVIAWGRTRARGRGPRSPTGWNERASTASTTNRDFLVRVLRSPEFLAGDTTTDFIERVAGLTDPLTRPGGRESHAVVAAVAQLDARPPRLRPTRRRDARLAARLAQQPQPTRAASSWPATTSPSSSGATLSATPPVVEIDGIGTDVEIHRVVWSAAGGGDGPAGVEDATVDATIDGVRRRYLVVFHADAVGVDSPLGSSTFRIVDRLARYRLARARPAHRWRRCRVRSSGSSSRSANRSRPATRWWCWRR